MRADGCGRPYWSGRQKFHLFLIKKEDSMIFGGGGVLSLACVFLEIGGWPVLSFFFFYLVFILVQVLSRVVGEKVCSALLYFLESGGPKRVACGFFPLSYLLMFTIWFFFPRVFLIGGHITRGVFWGSLGFWLLLFVRQFQR